MSPSESCFDNPLGFDGLEYTRSYSTYTHAPVYTKVPCVYPASAGIPGAPALRFVHYVGVWCGAKGEGVITAAPTRVRTTGIAVVKL